MQAAVSVQAMEWVLDHSPATGTDRLVLLAIARHADRDGGGAFPSAATIAAEAKVDRRNAFRSLQKLEAAGAIRVEHGGGRHKPNTYSVVMERCHSATVTALETVSTTVSQRHPSARETVSNRAETVSNRTRNGVTAPPEPSTNQLQPTTTPPTPPKRGCRLPEDFEVTPEMLEWARRTVPDLFVTGETEKFRDHWRAAAGRSAVKLDWVAAWRLWMRRAEEYSSRSVTSAGNNPATRSEKAMLAWLESEEAKA